MTSWTLPIRAVRTPSTDWATVVPRQGSTGSRCRTSGASAAPLQAPWSIEFRLSDGTVVSRTFQHPQALVELAKDGDHYKVQAIKVAA